MNFQGNAWNLGYVGCGSYTNVVRQNRTRTVLWQGWMSSAARVIPAMCWLPFPRIGGVCACWWGAKVCGLNKSGISFHKSGVSFHKSQSWKNNSRTCSSCCQPTWPRSSTCRLLNGGCLHFVVWLACEVGKTYVGAIPRPFHAYIRV